MKIIIYQPWGGLGDNLQFSTLPELFSLDGHEVYISSENVVRNSEIYDLVWGKNPYISGIINNNQGIVVGSNKTHLWPPESQNEYSMHRVEIAHGFKKTNFYPKIYYTPKNIPSHNNDIIIDLTGSSQIYTINKYIEYIDYFLPIIKDKDSEKKIKIILFENIINQNIFKDVYKIICERLENIEFIYVKDIYQYCDIIKSCATIIIVNSGVNSLAAAIKQEDTTPNIICYNPWAHFSKEQIKGCYNYKNVVYFQSKIF